MAHSWIRHWRARWLRLIRWRKRLTPAILWDSLMIYLALINVWLIGFDFTYLWLRPTYFQHLPVVVELYDPVKGIEPHPVTSGYLARVEALKASLAAGSPSPSIAGELTELRELSRQMIVSKPFDRSGQSRNIAKLEVRLRRYFAGSGPPIQGLPEAFDRLWSPGSDLAARHAFFERELRPLLAVNYHREYDLDGAFVDYGWLVDLPFLVLFTLEFGVRWFLALRGATYSRWFLFPIFNWYDLLGIVPLPQFRLFRLFRIASIYVRLYRSDRSGVGSDPVSRTVKYFANIVNEEISDMVSLRILSESQEEIREGTHRRIIRAVVEPRRDALARELTMRMRDILASPEVRDRIRAFLDANLKNAVENAEALQRIPLRKSVVRPLVETIGTLIFDAIVQTLAGTLDTEQGQELLEDLLGASIDGLVEELTEGEIEVLVREISLESLEHVKKAVAVRKWVEVPPDKPISQFWQRSRNAEKRPP